MSKMIATVSFSCNVGTEKRPKEFVAEAGETVVDADHKAVELAPDFWEPAE